MKHLISFRWPLVAVCLFVFLQLCCSYHFYYIEQNQLFLFTTDYFLSALKVPGGLTVYMAEWMTQFFMLPYAGPLVVSILLTCAGMLCEALFKRLNAGKYGFVCSLFPLVSLLLAHFNFNYYTQGTVAYLFMLGALYLTLRIADATKRLIAATLVAMGLFFLSGSVAILYALCLFVITILNRTKRWYLFALPVTVTFVLALVSVRFACFGHYRFALLPDAYYHPQSLPGASIYISWWILPFLLLAVKLVSSKQQERTMWLKQGVLAAVLVGFTYWGIQSYGDFKSAKLKELDFYARTQQWPKIIEACKGKVTNLLYMNYLNMALAREGMLGDQMFAFDQREPRSLMVNWNKTAEVSALLSDVYFAIGDIASAQEMAFEGNVAVHGYGSPRMLMRLVQTNLIYGAYQVAEKYISLLEQTFFYDKWAGSHRKFLGNDALIEQDPLLGSMRRCLPDTSRLVTVNGALADMEAVAVANPQHKAAFQYLAGVCLLSKDLAKFKELIDKYHGTPVLPSLPVPYQEAVIAFAEKDTAYWRTRGVTQEVVRRFSDYKRQVVANRNYPNAGDLLAGSYGKTYWYFYMFK